MGKLGIFPPGFRPFHGAVVLLLGFFLLVVSGAWADDDDDDAKPAIPVSQSAGKTRMADVDDLSRGMEEPINVEEAWVENSLFLFLNADNGFSKGHSLSLESEWECAFGNDLGGELDFPQFLTSQPLGAQPLVLGPVGLGLRYVLGQFGTEDSLTAGAFSFQGGGAFWASPNDRFKAASGNLTLQALGAFRWGRLFLMGNYGYGLDPAQPVFNGWTAHSSLGCSLGGPWVAQMEGDFSSNAVQDADDGVSQAQWVLTPQVGFSAGQWFFELGEEFNAAPGGTTVLMTELDLG